MEICWLLIFSSYCSAFRAFRCQAKIVDTVSLSRGSKDGTKTVRTFPPIHRTLAIMSFISPAVKSPNSPDFFLGDGVVDIVSVGNIGDGVFGNGWVRSFWWNGGLLWCTKALDMGCGELLMLENTVCWVVKKEQPWNITCSLLVVIRSLWYGIGVEDYHLHYFPRHTLIWEILLPFQIWIFKFCMIHCKWSRTMWLSLTQYVGSLKHRPWVRAAKLTNAFLV